MAQNAQRHILAVDDSEDVRDFYQLVLQTAGYQVTLASSGPDALDKAQRQRPDLVLLDIMMPGMDGLETLARLREDLPAPPPPVILCSGFDLSEEEAVRRGALMILRKPVAAADLLAHIDEGLLGRRAPAEVRARGSAHAWEARRQVREAATALLARIDSQAAPGNGERAGLRRGHLRWLTRYLGVQASLLGFLRQDRLTIEGLYGLDEVQVGHDLGDLLPQCYDVLETGSSLAVPDAACHAWIRCDRLAPFRFFAGVPVMAPERLPVGVLCVVDRRPRALAAEDLAILELLGRLTSTIYLLLAAGRSPYDLPGRFGAGVLPPKSFTALLDFEAAQLRRRGGSLALALIDGDDPEAASQMISDLPDGRRVAAGSLGGGRLGLYQRSNGDGATAAVDEALRRLAERLGPRATGVASVSGAGLPAITGADLARLAELALDEALEEGGTHHLVLSHQPPAREPTHPTAQP